MKAGLVKLPLDTLRGLLKLPKDVRVESIFITSDDLPNQSFTVRVGGDSLPDGCEKIEAGGPLKKLSLVYQAYPPNTQLVRIDIIE